MQYTLRRQMDRVLFRILRTFPATRKTLAVVRDGPLKGYRISISVGNPCLFGTYEDDAISNICRYIGPQDVVFDLGANAGYYSMIFAQKTKNQVHAFEPMPEFQAMLRNHLRINGVNNVVVHPMAVSDTTGVRQFTNLAATPGNTYRADSERYQSSASTIDVNVVSVDDMVYERGTAPPKVMKIDVEGAELDVLRGADRVLREHRPVLLLGTHELHVPGIRDQCCDHLRKLGYDVRPTAEQKSDQGLDDFLCIPPQK